MRKLRIKKVVLQMKKTKMKANSGLLSVTGPWSTLVLESIALNKTTCQSSVDCTSKNVSIELKILSKLAGGFIHYAPPLIQSTLFVRVTTEQEESRPCSICMPRMLKIYINSTSRHKAQPRSGMDEIRLSTVFRRAGAYASRSGLSARKTLVRPTESTIVSTSFASVLHYEI